MAVGLRGDATLLLESYYPTGMKSGRLRRRFLRVTVAEAAAVAVPRLRSS